MCPNVRCSEHRFILMLCNGHMYQYAGTAIVRRVRREDLPSLAVLFAECLREEPGPYTPDQVEAALSFGVGRADAAFRAGRGFIAHWRNKAVGSAAWSWRDPRGSVWEAQAPPGSVAPIAMIRAVAASPCFPGKGLGRRMLDAAIHDARAAGARSIALVATLGAVNFYRRARFEPVREFDAEIAPSVSLRALLMRLNSSPR